MDAARLRAGMTVQDLWLHYVALGGGCDAFELDGYLQGLMPLEAFQQNVLAQAINEALDDHFRAHRIPLSTPSADDRDDNRLTRLAQELLHGRAASPPPEPEPPDAERA